VYEEDLVDAKGRRKLRKKRGRRKSANAKETRGEYGLS
jgi:hypothetical protein